MRKLLIVIGAGLALAGASIPGRAALPPNLTALVNPFIGTSGTPVGGPIDTFPGADLPFGMIQWSPDTPSQNAGGGYEYTDHTITGFSLTHLSGPGCNVFGDFSILPTVGAIADPQAAAQPFSHTGEVAAPGWYAVTVGNPGVRAELAVTSRTGLGAFAFPATNQANLLFNVSSNQNGVTDAHVRIDGPTQISGTASSGFFCGMPDTYTVYFVARFDRPFVSSGTWKNATLSPGSASADGPGSGAWVTFDTTRLSTVKVKVGLSFVDPAGAMANLRAENGGWDVVAMRDRANEIWSGMLHRIAISGGTSDQQTAFYTAFYHTLLHPNAISDADGRYPGFDGKIHRVQNGHIEYANFSDWDIYRTEVPLLALIAPGETSDMMQSLVDAANQEGWLPRWALVNGPTSVMGGDSVDPVIAGAYAFGAHDFDLRGALRAMVKGASTTAGPPGQGWYVERWELNDDYLKRGDVVNTHTTSVSPVPNGASETLEYALDDFSIARFARAIGDNGVYATFLRRSSNWSTLFDTSTGWVAPRDADGAFMQAPITENGQSGFQEGNAAQYTWMVPQDLHGLIAGMGGNEAANAKLDTFFTQINADQNKPYAWLGNEASLGSPWVYLSTGAPWRTQAIVREALTTLYRDAPDGLPGNDDLGTMSAWYVWCAIGLYPQNPSVRLLDIGSPLFTSIAIRAPGNGPAIDIEAPQAATGAPYVQSLRVDGRAAQSTWLALPAHRSVRLDFELASTPNKSWGSAPGDAPPSYSAVPVSFPTATPAKLVSPPGSIALSAGASAPATFSIDNSGGSAAAGVTWRAVVPAGLHLLPDRGTETVAARATASIDARISADDALASGYQNVTILATASNGALLEHRTIAVRVAARAGGAQQAIAYAQNRFGNTITPVDLATGAVGPEIKVGEEPRDAVLSPDGARLYVSNRGDASVSVVDTAQERTVATIKVGHAPNGIHIAPDGRTVWVANNDDATIQSIDVATLKPGDPIRVGSNPRDIAIAPDGLHLYVSNGGSNSVTPVDLTTRAPLAPIAVGRRPSGIAITPDGTTLYVVDNASNDVTPVDVASGRALAPIRVGVSPMLVAIAPNGRIAYVSNYANSTITPIDLSTKTALAPIVVGGAPYGIAFTHDGKTALIVVRRDNALVTLDVATGRVGKPLLLGNGPYTVAAP